MSSNNQKQSVLFTFSFIVVLCFACSVLLSVLSIVLRDKQSRAEEFNESRELLMAAVALDSKGHFLMREADGSLRAARFKKGKLKPSSERVASENQVFNFFRKHVEAFLVDHSGKIYSFESLGLNKSEYLAKNKKTGFSHLDYKLVYCLKDQKGQIDSYIFPIKGFGLWDAIYGFLAMEIDGMTVRGISWFEHKETPGLGAHISNPSWQKQFRGKQLFSDTGANLDKAPIGLLVVKPAEKERYQGARLMSVVDGIPGATLTGNGVMRAYKESMEPYRAFLRSLHKNRKKGEA